LGMTTVPSSRSSVAKAPVSYRLGREASGVRLQSVESIFRCGLMGETSRQAERGVRRDWHNNNARDSNAKCSANHFNATIMNNL
jgi:hypothetical protein